ncbi:hypothetical protein AJ79_01595 [Helicocarpus griseus UAMH5409]|uniref:RRM domain-containing protein n=1 Tax=Helicocarpus griseus UAMH5409 TaxID=1447875 RepID=A0A2B7Y759_9EURO|nr:hypothetical protein AJ79_01595 [Helicocarpus griseus UAMH5409]
MAAGKEAVSFDEIIQAARERRKKQALTDKFFENKRRSSAPAPGSGSGARSTPGSLLNRVSVPGNLASRAGVGKKSAPAASRKQATAAPSRPSKQNRMLDDLITGNGQAKVQDRGPGISIKGVASGPCVVLGSNFAPGTTAADIESALEPVGGAMLGCRIVSMHPVVAAEMIFEERSGAESVVARFNNQKADGRILHVRIKPGPPPQLPIDTTQQQSRLRHHRSQPTFDTLREQADRERERREQRRADPQIQDGRYGFDDPRQSGRRGDRRWPATRNGDSGLYSDQMVVDEPAVESRGRRRRGR